AHHRARYKAEIRRREIPPADAGQTEENLAELVALGHALHLRARIGDGDEAIANFASADLLLHLFKEILLVDVWLERTAGLARDDADSAFEVDFLFDGFDLSGIGRIQDVEFGEAFDLAEGEAQNFRAET